MLYQQWRGEEGTGKKVVVFGVFKAKALLLVKGQRGEWRERPLPQNQWVDFPKVFDFSQLFTYCPFCERGSL